MTEMVTLDPTITDPEQIVTRVLAGCMRQGDTHVHIEPGETGYRLRCRRGDELRPAGTLSRSNGERLVAAARALARLSDPCLPEDGYFVVQSVAYGVTTIPVLEGQALVISRGLPDRYPDLDQVLSDHQRTAYFEALSREKGLILLTGPMATDSVQAALAYHGLHFLQQLNGPDYPVATVEWVARGTLENVTRVVVSQREGITFHGSLKRLAEFGTKAFRVGELHDLATAEEAMRLTTQRRRIIVAGISGTGDAASALVRLVDMGVPVSVIADSVRLVLALRVFRKLCSACHKPVQVPRYSLLASGFPEGEVGDSLTLWEADRHGCKECTGGFSGLRYICQAMPISKGVRAALIGGCQCVDDIDEASSADGARTMKQEILEAVRSGSIQLADADLAH